MGQVNQEQKTKVCSTCKQEKPVEEFHKNSAYRDGYVGQCKKCRNAKIVEYHRNNREGTLAAYKKYHASEAGKVKARQHAKKRRDDGKTQPYMKEYNRDPENSARAAYYQWQRKLSSYGITENEYNRMLCEQGSVCKLCSNPDPQGIRLAIDHNHSTGKVRDLLCGRCDKMIGLSLENPEILRAAADYLTTHAALSLT